MRGEPTGRLLLNFPVFAQMIHGKQTAKAVRIGGFNHTGETTEPKPEQFSLRFQNEDDANQFFEAVKVAVSRCDTKPTTEEKKEDPTTEEKKDETPAAETETEAK